MADQARKQTDKILADLEKEVEKIYSRASKELTEKWQDYMKSIEPKLNKLKAALDEAKRSGDSKLIAKAKEEYERAVRNMTFNNERYKALVNETTAKLTHTNEVATDYVNDRMAKVYTLNYNQFSDQNISGYTFTLVNEEAVKNLATKNKLLLPKKKIDIPKDKQWNVKNINSELLQGILQGESVSKIADRIAHVTDMNEKSAIRNARTMTTSAENKGRQDSFKKAEEDGVVMVREWVATQDERTRAWHMDLDGVQVGVDQPWENEYGEIMYPGDPEADPANVYNCRCSIRSIVKGFKWNEEEPISGEKSFIESLKDEELSPNIYAYNDIEDYWNAKSQWKEEHGELTRYIEDLNYENRNIQYTSSWGGKYDDKIPRIENTIVKLSDEYPLPVSDKEYGMHTNKFIVGDYSRAWEYLPDGDNDRRLTSDAAAQVFQNNNSQIVMAFNRNSIVSSIDDDIMAHEKVIQQGGILSSIGYSPEVTATHEYGHVMSNHFDNAMIYEDNTAKEYWNWYKSLSKEEIREGLSDYATTNRGEFEAECFAELHMPNPRPLALQFKEYLDEIIKKGY